MVTINIRLESKKYRCQFEIREKVTFIRGESGKGKTEFTRRINSNSSANKIEVSNGYEIIVLTKDLFQQSQEFALKHNTENEENIKFLAKYWSEKENFPYENKIILVDDEDFIAIHEFAVFYNCDKSNYYILINRAHLPSINYSVNEIYEFVADGINHYIRPYYRDLSYDESVNADTILVEGEGSDYMFFKKIFDDRFLVLNPKSFESIKGAGKAGIIKMLEIEYEKMQNKNILLIVDYCAFGSNIGDLIDVCKSRNIKISFADEYKSFEYLLLRSNFIADEDLDNIVDKHRLEYNSLENLFTDRLSTITSGKYYKYSKSLALFPSCYYDECCTNKQNIGDCDKRRLFINGDKFRKMFENTEFEFLVGL